MITQTFVAASIQNNKGGEDANRRLSIYLPPGYETSAQRYPVIYVLHGYGGTDSLMMSVWFNFKELLDEAIKTGKMRPMIVVAPIVIQNCKEVFIPTHLLPVTGPIILQKMLCSIWIRISEQYQTEKAVDFADIQWVVMVR